MSDKIVVVAGDETWTQAALHLAAALATHEGRELVLLKMVPVNNPALLGDMAGLVNFTDEEQAQIENMMAIAADYDVFPQLVVCEYSSWLSGMVDAAEQVGAKALFVQLWPTAMPFWRTLRVRRLQRQLAHVGCQLFALDQIADSAVLTY